jgi:hypothetical protein
LKQEIKDIMWKVSGANNLGAAALIQAPPNKKHCWLLVANQVSNRFESVGLALLHPGN